MGGTVRARTTRRVGCQDNLRVILAEEAFAPPIPSFVTKNDLFVNLGGRWYDEVDRVTTCS